MGYNDHDACAAQTSKIIQLKKHRKYTKKISLTLVSKLQMIILPIYNLQPEAAQPLISLLRKEKNKLLSSDTENREKLLMHFDLHSPGQCTGSILSLHCVRNHFKFMRKHVKELQWEFSVKLVICYITFVGFTMRVSSLHNQVIMLSRNFTCIASTVSMLGAHTSKPRSVYETVD